MQKRATLLAHECDKSNSKYLSLDYKLVSNKNIEVCLGLSEGENAFLYSRV